METLEDDVTERVALGRRWLETALYAFPDRDQGPLAAVLVSFFVDSTQGVPLDELGRYVRTCELEHEQGLAAESHLIVPWLSWSSVRAAYLARRLKEAGVI